MLEEPGLEVIKMFWRSFDYMRKYNFVPVFVKILAKLTEDGGWQGELKGRERHCGMLMMHQGKTEDS